MKKILIVNNNMHIGGIQKALLNLLNEAKGKFDITLLLFYKTGELLEYIPEEIKVIEGNKAIRIMGMTHSEAKNEGILTFLHRSFWTVMTRAFKIRFTFGILTHFCRLPKEYDCAVSFMQNGAESVFYGGCADFVLNSVKSKNKVCFIHCDFLNYGGNTRSNREQLKRFDKIAVVSDSVGEMVLKAVPSLKDKLYTVHNCINYGEIKKLKNAYEADVSGDAVKLFTAARLHREKGILRMLPILKNIKDKGVKFVWYIAGDGPDKNEIKRLKTMYELDSNIVLLGNLINPYPYFNKCDIVLVPSYDEAAPMVFSEAAACGTPVFTTDTTSAKEMVGSKKRGWVCQNSDIEIEKQLYNVLRNYNPCGKIMTDEDNAAAMLEFEKLADC